MAAATTTAEKDANSTPAELDGQKADDSTMPPTDQSADADRVRPPTTTTAPAPPDKTLVTDPVISPTDAMQHEDVPVAPVGLNVAEERQYYADYLKKHYRKDAEPNWTAAEILHLIEELRSGGSGK